MNSIGLDIGNHSIKLVELRHTLKGVFLTNFAIRELPFEASAGVIAGKVKELFHEENIKPRKVTIGVSGPQVAIRRISVPFMPKKELKEAVRWEAGKLISFPLEKAVVDFQLSGEIAEEGTRKLDLIVAAAQGEFIENQLAVIKVAGLKPMGVGIIPHALWHCMQMVPVAREGVTALIDIGATKTSINIVKDNRLQFTREITTAGNDFTEAIQEAATSEGAALDFAEAEEIKKEYGIPREKDIEWAKGHVPLQKMSFVIRPVLERLLSEINRSFEFYKSRSKEKDVERIFISGGGANLKGLKEYLADQLRTGVKLLTPFEDMEPALAIATGLALGRTKDINLLPEEYRLLPKELVRKYSPLILVCLVFFVFLGLYLKVDSACTRYREKLTFKKAQLADLQPANIRFVQLKEIKKSLDQEKDLLPKVVPEQLPWEEILKEISHIIPKKTTLTGIFFQAKDTEKELRLEGVTFGEDAKIVESIYSIMQGLEKSPFFSDVRSSFSKGNNNYSEPGANFEIRCLINHETSNK
jgi:type IV pilus assembly protein PilM